MDFVDLRRGLRIIHFMQTARAGSTLASCKPPPSSCYGVIHKSTQKRVRQMHMLTKSLDWKARYLYRLALSKVTYTNQDLTSCRGFAN
jgi:hypothetical protein